MKRSRMILLSTVALAAAGSGVFFSVINNYLIDMYNVGAEGRGLLEFFRELPGVLAVFFLGISTFFKEKYLMMGAALLISASFIGMAQVPSQYTYAVLFIFIWSIGAHINLVLNSSYSVALSDSTNHGRLFGAMGGARGLGRVIGAALVWVGMGYLGMNYSHVLIAASFFAALAAGGYFMLEPKKHTAKRRRRFVIRRKYSLFYMMAVLFGFRKQIFIVFAPWLLIKIFGKDASDIGMLMMISAFVGIFTRPFLGRLIDIFGERRILMADATMLFFICLSYGFVPHYVSAVLAVPALYLLFIVDDTLFSLRNAHTTYMAKISHSHDELTTTISVSYAIEHIVSMSGPIVAGIIWVKFGFSYVFVICAFAAVGMFAVASRIPSKERLMAVNA